MEESLKGDIQMLRNQLISEQTAKEKLEDTFEKELDGLQEQLGWFFISMVAYLLFIYFSCMSSLFTVSEILEYMQQLLENESES